MADTFKPGDVVELRSGGPQMTVYKVGPTGVSGKGPIAVWCEWFDGNTKSRDHFVPETLEIASGPKVR